MTPKLTLPRRVGWEWAFALLIACLAGVLYARTLQPSLGGMYNSEEYQQAAYSLSLAHSTGYPLYLLLGKLWVTLDPFGDVAFRMNVFSAFWAIGASVLTFFIILQLTRNRAVSLLGALLFVTNESVWRYASVAEVDTLTAFLAAAIILSLLLWRQGRLRLEVCALIYGFALAHHRISVFYAPGIILFIVLTRRDILRAPALVARAVLFALLPLLVYLYVPLRAWTQPDYVYDFRSLFDYVVGTSTSGNSEFATPLQEWPSHLDPIYHGYLWNWFTWLGSTLAVAGLWRWRHTSLPEVDQASTRWLLFIPFLLVSLFTVPTRAADIDRYLLVPVMILAIAVGIGTARFLQLIAYLARNTSVGRVANAVVLVALFGLPLNALVENLPKVDFSQNVKVYRFWNEAMDLPIERGASIIGNWSELNAVRYMQRVEGRRTDLQVIGAPLSAEGLALRVDAALAEQKIVYLTPGDATPPTRYHYSALGPLVRVSTSANPIPSTPPAARAESFGALTLLGYGLSVSLEPSAQSESIHIEPGQTARLTLYWRADETPRADYQVRVQLLDPYGPALWQNTEAPLHGFYAATRWRAGEYVTDMHNVYIPPGTPPCACAIQVALVNPATHQVYDSAAMIQGVAVTRAHTPLADQVFVGTSINVNFQDLSLLGYSGLDADVVVRAGDHLDFALAWVARDRMQQNYSARFRLTDATGRAWQEFTTPLVRDLPTSAWQKGDAFKEYYSLALSPYAPAGSAWLRVGLLDGAGHIVTTGTSEDISLFKFPVSQ